MGINSQNYGGPSPFERLLGAAQGVSNTIKGINELSDSAMKRKLVEDEADPNSEGSKFLRDFISKQTGQPLADTVSAMQAKQVLPLIGIKNDRDFQIRLKEMDLEGKKKAGDFLTPGQKAADTSFAKETSDYFFGGGKPTTEKNINSLSQAIETMQKNPDLTGGITTKIPGLSSDIAQNIINPKMAAVRDDIRNAIQASLRQFMGSAFTEKEGEAFFSRAFNPALSVEENIRRARKELTALQEMKNNKEEAMNYFNTHGSLVGYVPSKAAGPSQGPKAGQVVDGYMYKGGDPSKPESWVKAE